MRYAFLLPILTMISSSIGLELTECKCHTGFEPKDIEGRVKCVGTYVTTTKSCNIPERPSCKCTGSVSAILNNVEGTWCLEYARGLELRRWPCENQEDWERFYREYPNERP